MTRKKKLYCILVLALLLVACFSIFRFSSKNGIISPETAALVAISVTGFDKKAQTGKPVLEDVKQDIPFLSKNVSQKLWKISFNDFQIKNKEGQAGRIKLNFDVFIDSIHGNFVMARYSSADRQPYFKPDPPAHIAEKQLASIDTKYIAFVKDRPAVTLSMALDEISRKFGELGAMSDEICAINVIEKDGNFQGPIWAISMKGLPVSGMASRRPEVPLWERTVLRHRINAETGQWLSANNYPHWVEPKSTP